jgi:hypothetical protein
MFPAPFVYANSPFRLSKHPNIAQRGDQRNRARVIWMKAPVRRRRDSQAIDHLIRILLEAALSRRRRQDVGEHDWPKPDRRFRRWNLFWTEKEVLSKLFDSRSLNKYQLATAHTAGTKTLHYTQVARAVGSLLRRNAVEPDPDSTKRWRTGKISTAYRLTPFGKFLHLYHLYGLESRYGPVSDAIDTSAFFRCLCDLAIRYDFKTLKELGQSIMSISDERKRRDQLVTLLDLVFEAQDNLANSFWRKQVTSEFVVRAWWTWEDVRIHARHMPADCRVMLGETKKEVLALVHDIDTVLVER